MVSQWRRGARVEGDAAIAVRCTQQPLGNTLPRDHGSPPASSNRRPCRTRFARFRTRRPAPAAGPSGLRSQPAAATTFDDHLYRLEAGALFHLCFQACSTCPVSRPWVGVGLVARASLASHRQNRYRLVHQVGCFGASGAAAGLSQPASFSQCARACSPCTGSAGSATRRRGEMVQLAPVRFEGRSCRRPHGVVWRSGPATQYRRHQPPRMVPAGARAGSVVWGSGPRCDARQSGGVGGRTSVPAWAGWHPPPMPMDSGSPARHGVGISF